MAYSAGIGGPETLAESERSSTTYSMPNGKRSLRKFARCREFLRLRTLHTGGACTIRLCTPRAGVGKSSKTLGKHLLVVVVQRKLRTDGKPNTARFPQCLIVLGPGRRNTHGYVNKDDFTIKTSWRASKVKMLEAIPWCLGRQTARTGMEC